MPVFLLRFQLDPDCARPPATKALDINLGARVGISRAMERLNVIRSSGADTNQDITSEDVCSEGGRTLQNSEYGYTAISPELLSLVE